MAVAAGYTAEPLSKVTFRHSTKLGGVTVHLNLSSLQATVTIDGLGSKSHWSSSWRQYKLRRRNITLAGMEAMLDNPFRGTFCEPLEDGWVEHGSVVHRHTDHNMPGGPGWFGGFFQMMFAHFADVDVIHLDLLVNHNLNLNDEAENNEDVENNNDIEYNNYVEDIILAEDPHVAEDPLPFFAANSDDEDMPSLEGHDEIPSLEPSSNDNSEDQNDDFDKNDVEDQLRLTSSDEED